MRKVAFLALLTLFLSSCASLPFAEEKVEIEKIFLQIFLEAVEKYLQLSSMTQTMHILSKGWSQLMLFI